jgi:hypothetical protein
MSVHIRQPALDAVVVIAELFVVEAEQMKRGGVQVVAVGGIFGGFETEIIRGAVSGSTCDPTASHPGGEGSGIVIAAFAGALSGGLAAKLGGADHERALQQAA